MEIIFRVIIIIIITSECCLSSKHLFINSTKTWETARAFCREHYNDLSRLANKLEQELFSKCVTQDNREGWIGIYWNQSLQNFVWSGRENVNYNNNRDLTNIINLDSSHQDQNIIWSNANWDWHPGGEEQTFFCFSLKLVQEEKTWQEALEHCRKNGSDLSSLLSDTDTQLATNEMNYTDSTEPVWIGLRYLGDDWMWVNKGSSKYNAWPQGDQDHRCPIKSRCGALTQQGVWENRDCQEKLWFMCG